jgi:hypothetical protein
MCMLDRLTINGLLGSGKRRANRSGRRTLQRSAISRRPDGYRWARPIPVSHRPRHERRLDVSDPSDGSLKRVSGSPFFAPAPGNAGPAPASAVSLATEHSGQFAPLAATCSAPSTVNVTRGATVPVLITVKTTASAELTRRRRLAWEGIFVMCTLVALCTLARCGGGSSAAQNAPIVQPAVTPQGTTTITIALTATTSAGAQLPAIAPIQLTNGELIAAHRSAATVTCAISLRRRNAIDHLRPVIRN